MHRIAIEAFAYAPPELAVSIGDTVVWTNGDIVPHTVTAEGGDFDSGSIGDGASWTYVPSTPGTHAYVCTFHPNMSGTLVVR